MIHRGQARNGFINGSRFSVLENSDSVSQKSINHRVHGGARGNRDLIRVSLRIARLRTGNFLTSWNYPPEYLGHLRRSPPAARIRRVRIPVLILVLVMLAVGAALPATADVIHLKNGRTIWADQVRETKDHVEYDLGEDTYAIAKSSVDHIDAGGVAPVRGGAVGGSGNSGVPDITPPAPSFNHEADVAGKVIRDGKVDADGLASVAQSGNSELAATGYFLAGKQESDHGNFPQAKRYYESRSAFSRTTPPYSFTMPPH